MKSYTLAELANYLDGCLHGNAEHPIRNIASLTSATPNDVVYFDNLELLSLLKQTKAGAVLITAAHRSLCPVNFIVVTHPLDSMNAVRKLFPAVKQIKEIHPQASIAASAKLGEAISIGANTIIAEEVELADGVSVGANTVIEAGVRIGRETQIHNNVFIHKNSSLGAHVVVESGAVIGASPFNNIKLHGHWQQGPAIGGVFLADDVHLGANTVIARGALGDTFIAEGVHIDNLVLIAHDVTIGAHSAIAGCATIGAYTRIGTHCIIGGASCVAAHVHLIDDVVITGMSTVNKSLFKPGIYSSGTMVSEHQRWRRNAARFRRLDDYVLRLTKLEKEWQQGSL